MSITQPFSPRAWSQAPNDRPTDVLLAEDDEGDVFLAREGLRSARQNISLHHVSNGEQCLAFLRKTGIYSTVPTPDLVLLDLNMPGMTGHEVLSHISTDPVLRSLPVLVLSSSASDADVFKAYQLGGNTYFVKSADFEETMGMYRTICDYWLGVAALPPKA